MCVYAMSVCVRVCVRDECVCVRDVCVCVCLFTICVFPSVIQNVCLSALPKASVCPAEM